MGRGSDVFLKTAINSLNEAMLGLRYATLQGGTYLRPNIASLSELMAVFKKTSDPLEAWMYLLDLEKIIRISLNNRNASPIIYIINIFNITTTNPPHNYHNHHNYHNYHNYHNHHNPTPC